MDQTTSINKNVKKGYYEATSEGIWYYGPLMEIETADILHPIEFLKKTNWLDENEIIYTFLDENDQHLFEDLSALELWQLHHK